MEKKSNQGQSHGLGKTNIFKRIAAIAFAVVMVVTLSPQSLLKTFDVKTEAEAASTLSNPRIVADSSMTSGQKVTWDCIYFGSYPQTEIVDQARTSGSYGKRWSLDSDYEVNAGLYSALKNASYNSNGDTTIDNTKYRRIKKSDATGVVNFTQNYSWDTNNVEYHYFRYEPIKWRVLNVSGNQALLLADIALDCQRFNTIPGGVDMSWEISTIRSWMNGYGSSGNAYGTDYSSKNFIDTAFDSNEKNSIITTSVVNENDAYFHRGGGNNTNDKIFLLSQSEVYNSELAKSYGFVQSYVVNDEARMCKSSTFAKAMGTYSDDYSGCCNWGLRTAAPLIQSTVYVNGSVSYNGGSAVYGTANGLRPALNLDLSYSSYYTYAGTESSEIHKHSWNAGDIIKQSTIYEAGIKVYTCTSCGATRTEDIAQLKITQPEVSGTSLTSVKNTKGRKLTIKWKKNSHVKGYVIQMSTNKTFKSGVIQRKVSSYKVVSLKSPKLKKKKTYYVRVRTYKLVNGQSCYSAWSKVKKVKIKK